VKIWLIPLSLALVGGTARADQCQWIDATVAEQARSIVKKFPTFVEYCEPCGDPAPGVPQHATSVALAVPEPAYRELRLDGKAVDLAYVFVKTDATRYRNLAALAGCPATGVSPSLAITAETRDGILIAAAADAPLSTADVPRSASDAPRSNAALAPPPAPATPAVYVYTTTTREVAWIAIALAAAGGFLASSAVLLLVLAVRRRRRALRPRAVDLRA
jgi:hypothetical protein